ncbi:pantoate--beta-alanine ligase [Candidatus Latescibacterota bacterium]
MAVIEVISDIDRMRQICEDKRFKGIKIGLVPTMGAFHEGHLSLIRRALKKSDFIIVSIYVNPIQFGQDEDFDKYPRDLEGDVRLADSLGAHVIFSPDDSIIYPEGYSTYITVEDLTEVLCGRSRTTHFRGVTTVVAKLFNIIRPHVAVFGQKDAQQLSVIKKMVKDLNMNIEIDAGPIIRESDGLALSSRNKYLNKDEREQATVLFRSLEAAKELFNAGITDSYQIIEKVREILDEAPLAKTEYVEIVNFDTMTPVEDVSKGALVAIAVHFGETRLIDNIIIHSRKGEKNAG